MLRSKARMGFRNGKDLHNQITPISIIWKLCYHHFDQSRNGQFENSVNKISIKASKKFKNYCLNFHSTQRDMNLRDFVP